MSDRQTINDSVPPALERFLKNQVRSGRFRTASEVDREGLRLLQEAEHKRLLEKWLIEGLTRDEEKELPPEVLDRAKAHVRGLIDKGIAEARAGLLVDGPETMKKLRDELESRRKHDRLPDQPDGRA
jgi:putative addiction module CopG family antidote